jgi:hypothetical protein
VGREDRVDHCLAAFAPSVPAADGVAGGRVSVSAAETGPSAGRSPLPVLLRGVPGRRNSWAPGNGISPDCSSCPSRGIDRMTGGLDTMSRVITHSISHTSFRRCIPLLFVQRQ